MKTTRTRRKKRTRKAHHVATLGRVKVPVYKRTAPNGSTCFMVVNYASGKRRFDSYADGAEAIEAAGKLARQMSEGQVVAAAMTNVQASDYANAVLTLKPFAIDLVPAASAMADALRIIGGFENMEAVKKAAAQGLPLPDLSNVRDAAKFYRQRHKCTTPKPVADVVAELLKVKAARGASQRYLGDLRSRLNRFAADCKKDSANVTTADVQAWFDSQKLPAQSYTNFRCVIHLLFKFAVARGYAADNPIEGLERVKVRGGAVEIFTPSELARLLAAAGEGFLPCLAMGAFAGLRSAEIERLTWNDVDLAARHIVVGADAAKTASRRIIPVCDALAQWLAPYAQRGGKVWKGTHDAFYDAQLETAKATAVAADAENNLAAKAPVKWKSNGLRHSFASYRFAQIGDAGRVAGECGNSAAVIHKHYRELVRPADAVKWFAVAPVTDEKILPAPQFAAAVANH